jgi:hypothetical protein
LAPLETLESPDGGLAKWRRDRELSRVVAAMVPGIKRSMGEN